MIHGRNQKIERDLEEKWTESVDPVRKIIASRFERLKLKGEPLKVKEPVSEEAIQEITGKIKQMFPDIDPMIVTKAKALKNVVLKTWIDSHCRERQYTFQVRKCNNPECCLAPQLPSDKLEWLPDPVLDPTGEHYLPLDQVIGIIETTDSDRPSLNPQYKSKGKGPKGTETPINFFMVEELENQKKDSALFTAQNARTIYECQECNKPRVVYSKQKLSRRQELSLALALSEEYTCGSGTSVSGVQLRISLCCGDPVELAYYSSQLGRSDICCFCASNGAEKDTELLTKFKTVLPCCGVCIAKGKSYIVARPYGKKK